MRVTCFGSAKDTPAELYEEMKAVGRLLALRKVGIATGAFGGASGTAVGAQARGRQGPKEAKAGLCAEQLTHDRRSQSLGRSGH